MKPKITIPVTPIWRRYEKLLGMSRPARLEEANRLAEHPQELADEFADSVMKFSSYINLDEPFYPLRGANRQFDEDEEIRSTSALVLRLEKQNGLVPTDASDRQTNHEAGATITAIPASQLACAYVDRELLVQQTRSPAEWDSDRPSWRASQGSDKCRNVGGLRLDVLLADSVDRTPIVGEVKFPGDKDPFFALIQALACAAHLATSNQYERMRRKLHGNFPARTAPPRLDVWVLMVGELGYHHGPPPKRTFLPELESAAETLAAKLLAQDSTRSSLRRIAGIGVNRGDKSDTITSEVRWAWGRAGD